MGNKACFWVCKEDRGWLSGCDDTTLSNSVLGRDN